DCTLNDLIDQLTPGWSQKGDQLSSYTQAQQQLATATDAIERFLTDCRCAAINPPCPPCDDPGVLLACFEVKDCKVVKICNTVRCYVLAPTTLRYWGLHDTHKMFAFCCKPKDKEPVFGTDDSYSLASSPRPFLYAPRTQRNMQQLRAIDTPANLHQRL